jgi:hypothetical protein
VANVGLTGRQKQSGEDAALLTQTIGGLTKARGIASDIPTRRRFAFQITLFQQHSREYGAKNNAVNRERYRQKFLKSALGISLEGRLSHKVGAVSKDR